jgi:putative drug exporter of the RND superfamily
MRRLASAVTAHPVRVLLVWFALLATGSALTAPGSAVDPAKVMKADQTDFLPTHYESVRAARLLDRGFPTPDGAKATIVIRRADHGPVTGQDVRRAASLLRGLTGVDGVRYAAVDTTGISPNKKVLLGALLFKRTLFDQRLGKDVDALRDRSDDVFRNSGLIAGYAGDAPSQVDATERSGLTSQLTMLVILVLMGILFRSVVVAFMDVLLVGLVGAIATSLIVIGAKLFGYALDTSITGLLPIVVLGVGTDYVVFLLHRYREHLRDGLEPRAAMRRAIRRIGPAIGYSAMTVVVSLSALLLSSLQSLRVMGPALGFGVLMTLLAALTVVPAVAVLLKRRLFWPGKTLATHTVARESRTERFVAGKPIGAAVAAIAVLAALAIPALGFKPDYNTESQVPGSQSAKAFHELRAGFPAGALDPTQVLVTKNRPGRLTARDIASVSASLERTPGVGNVKPAVVSRDGRIAEIDALLTKAPFSEAALDTMDHQVRPAMSRAEQSGTTVEVGGNTSAFADVRDAINNDQKLIFPIAALFVGLILVVLLRSLMVPLFVMFGVALGFAATLGASVIAFQAIGGKPGLFFQLPLIVYLFVASMTSDYAILVLSRVREEMRAGHSSATAVATALRTAGPSVVAAGVILASSFAVLVLSPSLGQVGFAVAVGILLSSVLTARILIPALTVLGGRRAWWPSRLRRTPEPVAPADLQTDRRERDREEVMAA